MSVVTRIPSVEPLRPESVASVIELRRGVDREPIAPVREIAPQPAPGKVFPAGEGLHRTQVDPALACLPASVEVAAADEARCDHAEGACRASVGRIPSTRTPTSGSPARAATPSRLATPSPRGARPPDEASRASPRSVTPVVATRRPVRRRAASRESSRSVTPVALRRHFVRSHVPASKA